LSVSQSSASVKRALVDGYIVRLSQLSP
jgi:hypothetical protein